MRRIMITILGLSWHVASADVVDSAEGGFTLVHEVQVAAGREDAWRAAVHEVGQGWRAEQAITGDAGNMSIDARPQGCFCEAVGDDGGVVHLTVTFVNPNVLIRLTGGLGPLGLLGVDGNMVWEFLDANDGTTVRFSYAVGGYRPGGLDEMAGPVDDVIGEALQRLKFFIETGSPETAAGG